MSICNLVSIPFEDPFNIPEGSVIDFSDVHFSEDQVENMTTAMIYLRNIEYSGNISFEKMSYDEKANLLKLYMLRDLQDLNIKQLDYTLFNMFLDSEKLDGTTQKEDLLKYSILDENEIVKFISEHQDIVREIYRMTISLGLYIISLDKSDMIKYTFDGLEHIEEMPMTYECFLSLMKYREFDLIGGFSRDSEVFNVKSAYFKKIFYYENSRLADVAVKTTFSTVYGMLLDKVSEHAKKE